MNRKFFYNDSLGFMNYSFEDTYGGSQKELSRVVSNKWYKSYKADGIYKNHIRPILICDSTFSKNKLKSINYSAFDGEFTAKIVYGEYYSGKHKEIYIWDTESNKSYLSNYNGFYEKDMNVSPKYAEWLPSSRLTFGKIHKKYIDTIIKAYYSIPDIYRQMASMHGFNFNVIYQGLFK